MKGFGFISRTFFPQLLQVWYVNLDFPPTVVANKGQHVMSKDLNQLSQVLSHDFLQISRKNLQWSPLILGA